MTHTCSRCDARWSGLRMAHCAAPGCCATFSTVANFDRHRRGGRCVPPADAGLVPDSRGVWRMPGQPDDADTPVPTVGVEPEIDAIGWPVPSPQLDPSDPHSATQRLRGATNPPPPTPDPRNAPGDAQAVES